MACASGVAQPQLPASDMSPLSLVRPTRRSALTGVEGLVMTQSRKHRGYRSQSVVAAWFAAHGWPFAESTGAGRSGSDVTGVPGLMVEVKARRAFSPLAWLRQTTKEAEQHNGLPFVVFRCDGQGEANVGEWGVLLRLDDMTTLLHEAGYGDKETIVVSPT